MKHFIVSFKYRNNQYCSRYPTLFNFLIACLKHQIKRLVYTSTYNVIFGGQEIRDGEESLPYLPLNQVSQFWGPL